MNRLRKRSDFAHDTKLVQQLHELTQLSYVDDTAILQREMNHCRDIYLLYDEYDELLAFFMVNFEKVGNRETCYMGFTVSKDDHKGTGGAKFLWDSFFMDCKEKELASGHRIPCWWTTASPIPYLWFNAHMDYCEPTLDGHVSPAGQALMNSIRQEKYHQAADDAMPFVMYGIATNTRYSKAEHERVLAIEQKLKIKAFEQFPIDEQQGDRYLMIGYAPEVTELRKRLGEERRQAAIAAMHNE